MSRSGNPSHPVLLFDGVCNLCNAAVQWVIARDRHQQFRFASLQSRAGREAIARARGATDSGAAEPGLVDSVILIDEAGAHTRSDAAIRVARRLGFPWSLAAIGGILPRGARDALYDWIARNRYRWFGRRQACAAPPPEQRARFLDADEPPDPESGAVRNGVEPPPRGAA